MGKRAARDRSIFSSWGFWTIILGVIAIAVTAGVTAYFVWPSTAPNIGEESQAKKITKEDLRSVYEKGDYKSLIADSAKYLSENKNDIEARRMLATALVLTGNSARAVDEYKTLIAFKPNDGDLLYQAGIAMNQLGRVKDALEYLGRATKAAANVPIYHAEMARTLVKDGQHDAALFEWQQVLAQTAQTDRYRATIFAEMASVYVAKGQTGAAKEIVDNGLAIDPQNEYLKALSEQISEATTGRR